MVSGGSLLCLATDDPRPEERQRLLQQRREALYFVFDGSGGLPRANAVPPDQKFPPQFALPFLRVGLRLLVSRILSRFRGFSRSADGYRALLAALPAPEMAARYTDDQVFAWQRVAGLNPFMLELATRDRLARSFPLTEAQFEQAVGRGASLDASLAEGRLFIADYGQLDGLPAGAYQGEAKVLVAPLALFHQQPDGLLMPVAIQVGQGAPAPIVLPGDGAAWLGAKTLVQMADLNVAELVYHLGESHLLMERFVVAAERQFSERHPILALLRPHFAWTLAINHHADSDLLAAGGRVEQVFALTLEGAVTLAGRGLAGYDLRAAMLPRRLASRGVDSTDGLRTYPYRDDGVLVWGAIRGLVAGVVEATYADDAAVVADPEVRGFFTELGSPDGGRLENAHPPEQRDELIDLLTHIIFCGSASHAAVNFVQYPYSGFVAGMPGAVYAPFDPERGFGDDELARMLPPRGAARVQVDLMYQLSNLRINQLGVVSDSLLADPLLGDPFRTFARRLAEIETEIEGRESGRLLPYPFLKPSRITASIHI